MLRSLAIMIRIMIKKKEDMRQKKIQKTRNLSSIQLKKKKI